MPPIYLTSDLLSYKRKPNLFNPARRTSADDPYFANVILYLKGDSTIEDSSAYSHLLAQTGGANISIDNVNYKYGNGSLYFPGDSELSLSSAEFASIGSSDYTVEFWIKTDPLSTQSLFQFGNSRAAGKEVNTYSNNLRSHGTSFGSINDITNTWAHIAITRQGVTLSAFKNGVFLDSQETALDITDNDFYISKPISLTKYLTGNIDSFRVTTAARYTANFDPETDTYLA